MSIFFAVILIFFLSLSPHSLHPGEYKSYSNSELIAWNVGQGQWITIVEKNFCLHFDTGGETAQAVNKVLKLCTGRDHAIFISHGDWDHISNLKSLINALKQNKTFVCSGLKPTDPIKNLTKWPKNYLDLPDCPAFEKLSLIYNGKNQSKDRNNHSIVYLYKANKPVLITGDAPTATEKIWLSNRSLKETKILILGHHGSRTSTGRKLLNALPGLQLSIASARKQKYGHPHVDVLKRLSDKKIPNLVTEDWGNIKIDLN
jgi:competence protein ComEC